MIGSSDITIRPMRDEDHDYNLMAKWLKDPKVYDFIHGKPKTLDWVKKKYSPRILKKEKMNACFVEFKSMPVGYIQYFNI